MLKKLQGPLALVGVLALAYSVHWMQKVGQDAMHERQRTAPIASATTPPDSAPSTPETAAATAINLAKHEVTQQLKDPASAEFRELYAVKTPAGGLLVCGEVNSKNSFGAKAGFTRFIWNTKVILHEATQARDQFAAAWNGSCAAWETVLKLKR